MQQKNSQIICTDCNQQLFVPDGYRYDHKSGGELSRQDRFLCRHYLLRLNAMGAPTEEYITVCCEPHSTPDEPLQVPLLRVTPPLNHIHFDTTCKQCAGMRSQLSESRICAVNYAERASIYSLKVCFWQCISLFFGALIIILTLCLGGVLGWWL